MNVLATYLPFGARPEDTIILSLLITLVIHTARTPDWTSPRVLRTLREKHRDAVSFGSAPLDRHELLDAARAFHWTWLSVLLSWLPFEVMVFGFTLCSLMRETIYSMDFPWPQAVVVAAVALVYAGCEMQRRRIIRGRAFEARREQEFEG